MFSRLWHLNRLQFQNLCAKHSVKLVEIQWRIGVNSFPQFLASKPQFYTQDAFGLVIKFQP